MSSVINQTLKLFTDINKARRNKDIEFLTQLGNSYDDNWDKDSNNIYFGHNAVINGFIPTQYAPLNHIVEHFKPLAISYEVTDTPKTKIDFSRPSDTHIYMPHPSVFKSPKYYASTMMHELTHATQIPLQRLLVEPDSEYLLARGEDNPRRTEELVAQLTSCKLLEMVGEDVTEWSSVYLASALVTMPEPLGEVLLEVANDFSDKAFQYLVNLGN